MSATPRNETNPFQPPAKLVGGLDSVPIPDAEITRRSYLAHESRVRSLGLLGYVAAGLALALAIAYANEFQGRRLLTIRLLPAGLDAIEVAVLIAWLVGLAGILLVLSFGLQRLAPWARWLAAAGAGLSFVSYLARFVLALALGTSFIGRPGQIMGNTLGLLASGYVLVVLLSRRSGRVFGREYRAMVRQTPEIRPYVALMARVVIGTILGLILIGLISLGVAEIRKR